MMTPKIAANKPAQIELKAGETYYFCSCGLSADGLLCDGSHKGTGMRSIAYTPEVDEVKWVCACKQSGGMPFCDGSHKVL